MAADELSPYLDTCHGFLPGIGNTSCTLPTGKAVNQVGERDFRNARSSRNGSKKKIELLDECQQFDSQRCVMHLMAFGGMVVPHTEFVLRITKST